MSLKKIIKEKLLRIGTQVPNNVAKDLLAYFFRFQ